MPRWAALVISLATGLWGCAPAAGRDDGIGDRSSYPGGPYGKTEGAVIADLSFVEPDGAPISLADLHADPDVRVLLLVTAAGWCTACIEEQSALQELFARYGPRGLRVLVTLFEDRDFEPADAALAAAWKEEHALTIDVVADAPFQLGAFYDSSLTPMNMVVDVDDMEILRITTGWDPDVIEGIIAARLP
jgi:hypothetical protein